MITQQQEQESTPLNQHHTQFKPQSTLFTQFLMFTTKQDQLLMVIGFLSAILNGATMPLFGLLFGQMANSFTPNTSKDQILNTAITIAIYLFILGIGAFLFSFIMFATWMKTGERIGINIRKMYFQAILQQEIQWFDQANPNQLSSKIANQTFTIQGAIGEKIPSIVVTISLTFFGFFLAFITGWQLALVTCATIPPLTLTTTLLISAIGKKIGCTQSAYDEAGGIAEEV